MPVLWRCRLIAGDALRLLQSHSRDCDLPVVLWRDVRRREILLALWGEGKPQRSGWRRVAACPRCQTAMNAVNIGTTSLLECSRCEGIWVDVDTLNQISADREKQALVAGAPTAAGEDLQLETNIRYVPCPVCHELMNRDQFAHCSHVIVDVCKPHGIWFDKDELRRAVQFIRAGGLEKARSQELEQLKDEQRRLAFARLHSTTFEPQTSNVSGSDGADIASSAIKLLFRLLG
jgi:Zn-finger nucleic acid-binding protein